MPTKKTRTTKGNELKTKDATVLAVYKRMRQGREAAEAAVALLEKENHQLEQRILSRDAEAQQLEIICSARDAKIDELTAKSTADERAWSEERAGLKKKIDELEKDLRRERHTSSKSLDVADNASLAMSGMGRLIHMVVTEDLLAQLRIEAREREEKAKEESRNRTCRPR